MDKAMMETMEFERAARRTAMMEKFNEEFGDDISNLRVSLGRKEGLEARRREIEKALSLENRGDPPSKIALALQQVQSTVLKINKLTQKQATLQQFYGKHQEEVEMVKRKVSDFVYKINELEKTGEYLKIVERIGEISDMIEEGIYEKNDKKQEAHFMMLKSVYKSLKAVKCDNLLAYTSEMLRYWHNILKEKFGNDYVDHLRIMKWPFVREYVRPVPTPESINKLQMLTEYLLNIELDENTQNSSGSDVKPLCTPMSLLIRPFRKRFMYHFMGTRKTNRIDKPEWFLTHVLTWIKDHQDFIEKNLQPVYDRAKKKDELAKIEFIRGLTEMIVEKLHYELPELQYDDSLFSHCIDEALGFQKEIRNGYGFPDDEPGVLKILSQAPVFVKWIKMENQYATEKMIRILSKPTAFDLIYAEELDSYRTTDCAESFLRLLSTIKERYEMLPQPGHRLQFLQLELDLIDDFRIRLRQKLRETSSDPLNTAFPSILNTINYVRNVLEDLGADPFFLRLQFYKLKLEGRNEFEGSVFDEFLDAFAAMRDEHVNVIVDHVFMDVKAKSMPYRKNRWHALDSPRGLIRPSLTGTACQMFQVLIDRLHQLKEILANNLFTQAWSALAAKLDQFFYEEIVAISIFNDGGALQFNYDITKNLFPLFGQYSSKPEGHFKLLKDACVLLIMPPGVAMSLRDTLLNVEESDIYDSAEVMQELGIFTMKRADVLSLISRRTDVS